VYEGVFGSRRIQEGPAMTRDTIFRVASMVKLITTVAALRLVEQGKLSLEAPVPDIDPVIAAPRGFDGFDPAGKPVLRPAKRPISLHDLLTHTAGFVYRLWDSEALKYYKALDKLPAADRNKLPRAPLMFDPGERWQYGGNIDWVGRIVQAVSGEPLDVHFRKHIFEPLGMNDTGFVISPAQWAREASGHRRPRRGVASRTDGAPAEVAACTSIFFRWWRHLFEPAGLSHADPHADARGRAQWCAHSAPRHGGADGTESDWPDRRRRPSHHCAGSLS